MYTNPNNNVPMKNNISIKPIAPSALKLMAQGYINITSTANITNRIATKKYLIEQEMENPLYNDIMGVIRFNSTLKVF